MGNDKPRGEGGHGGALPTGMTVYELYMLAIVEDSQEVLGELKAAGRRGLPASGGLPITPENRGWLVATVHAQVWHEIGRKAAKEHRYWVGKREAEINKKRRAIVSAEPRAHDGGAGEDPARSLPGLSPPGPAQAPTEGKP